MENPIPILLYHKVCDFDVSGTWVTPLQFEQQMRYLHKNGWTTITPNELKRDSSLSPKMTLWTQDVRRKTQNAKYILITFDDGYAGFYEKALPTLLKYGFRATIFVISGYIGKANLWDVSFGRNERHLNLLELRELIAQGFVIGSHTRTHPDLTRIPINKAKEELLGSKRELEDKLGDKVEFLSYPFGRYNDAILNLALDAGYELSFSSNPLTSALIVSESEAISYPVVGRMGVYIIDRLADFKVKLQLNGLPYLAETKKAQLINFFSRGTWLWKTLNPLSKSCI